MQSRCVCCVLCGACLCVVCCIRERELSLWMVLLWYYKAEVAQSGQACEVSLHAHVCVCSRQ
jgi:hypothetical protein